MEIIIEGLVSNTRGVEVAFRKAGEEKRTVVFIRVDGPMSVDEFQRVIAKEIQILDHRAALIRPVIQHLDENNNRIAL